MDQYDLAIVLGLVGFITVAALLLVPVYRFLVRQEEASKEWTREKVTERQRKATNGASSAEVDPKADAS